MVLKPPSSKPWLSLPIRIILVAGSVYFFSYLSLFFTRGYWPGFLEYIANFVSPSAVIMGLSLATSALALTFANHFMFDKPLIKLEQSIKKVEDGNFLIRTPVTSSFELGRLAWRFNQMLSQVTALAARQAQAEHELVVAQEELKYRNQIEKQKQQLEEANVNLELAVKDLSLLYEIGQEINTIADLDTLYSTLCDTLQGYLKLTQLALMVYDDKEQVLQVKAVRGFSNEDQILSATFKKGEGISGQVLETGQRIYAKDTSNDKRFLNYKSGSLPQPSSFLAVPLNYKGKTVGVINYVRQGKDSFSFTSVRKLTMVANQVALAIANAKLYTKTRQLSVTDETTGLYNRRHFQQISQIEWKRAIRFNRPLSVVMIDIDHFKAYNDTHGHPQGDVALRTISQTMKRNLREVDLLSRFGGEEFIVLLPDTDKHGAIAVAEKLRALVEQLNLKTTEKQRLTISAGIANFPDDVTNADDMVDHADIALYRAKEEGRNLVVCFKPPVDNPETPEEESEEVTNKTYVQ